MSNDDSDWLGEQASLGPMIRAGLGILLEQGDWAWWHHPGSTAAFMLNAVKASGIVEWGGDPTVLVAQEWLELNIALEVASAFKTLIARRGGDLRIKISRGVYSWNDTISINEIQDDLARAFACERIFSEWPADRRPRRPAASTRGGIRVSSALSLATTTASLIKALPRASWNDPTQPATIAVATITDLLQNPYSCELLIVLDQSREAVLPHIDTIRATTGAQCAIFLPADQPNIERWLTVFGAAIAAQLPIDRALAEANKEIDLYAQFLASTQSFMMQSDRTLVSSAREQERDEIQDAEQASNAIKLAKPTRHRSPPLTNLEIQDVKMEAPPPTVRVIDARVEQNGRPVTSFPASGVVDILLSIQPKTPLKFPTPAFPDEKLEWTAEHKVLQLHMLEGGLKPVSVPILLPRSGASTPAIFAYSIPSDGPIDLWFVVSEGTCILQTARMRGQPGSLISFIVEAMNSSVDQNKANFDVAIIVRNDPAGTPSAAILTSAGMHLNELEYKETLATRAELLALLEVCLEPDAPFDESLFNLANSGKIMLDWLRDHVPTWPTTMNRLQLTTPSNDPFPVEYLYDGELPANNEARLCTNRAGCLISGEAISNCEIRIARQQLCPMGFLGITTVIERRTWDRAMDKKLWLHQATDLAKRNRISDIRRALFAASDRADAFDDDDVPPNFAVTRSTDLDALVKGWRRNSWEEWCQSIADLQPKLLVLVPHIHQKQLYIGDEKKLAFGSLERPYVGNAGPIVVVIGCNSAIEQTVSTSLPAILLRAGAKVVIGTLTSALGRFANTAAANLSTKLIAASNGTAPDTIGELITQMRREFLSKDNALGMALIAFGDADICLGEPTT